MYKVPVTLFDAKLIGERSEGTFPDADWIRYAEAVALNVQQIKLLKR